MANTLKLKRSAVASKAPLVADLDLGELALNTYDGRLYTKKNDGSDAIVEIGASASVLDTITQELVYTATASQTLFSGADDNGVVLLYDTDASILVFLNGAKLLPAVDYTLDNVANTVTLTVGADLNDEIAMVSFNFLSSTALTATNVVNVPTGNIIATNVQAAIDELDTEKAALALPNSFTAAQFISTTAPQIILEETDQAVDAKKWALTGTTSDLLVRALNDDNTLNTEILRVSRAGSIKVTQGQLQFPVTQNASADATTLDDYEEGTFTPTLYGISTAGTNTYTTQEGDYTKCGDIVTCNAYIEINTTSGMAGALFFGGLPFTMGTAVSFVVCPVEGTSLTLSGTFALMGRGVGNTTTISIKLFDSTAGTTPLIPSDVAAGSKLFFSITYKV